MNTLITIPFSHYCEKARWALDWCSVRYVERACLPVLHLVHTKRIGGSTVPALVLDDGRALTDSSDILRWADTQAPAHKRLLPDDGAALAAARTLEDELDEGLGPATRVWAYAHGLRDRPLLRAMVSLRFRAPPIARSSGCSCPSSGRSSDTTTARPRPRRSAPRA